MNITKLCITCGKEYPATNEYFNKRSTSSDGLRNDCKECHRANATKHYNETGRYRRKSIEPTGEGLKQCSKCQQWKPATSEFFNTDRSKPDGLRPDCRDCSHQFNIREDVRQHTREYHARDEVRERNRELDKRRAPQKREYSKQHYHNNKEYRREYNKNYRNQNAEKLHAMNAEYRAQNPEKIRDSLRRSRIKHPNTMKLVNHRYQSRRRNLPDTFTRIEWEKALNYWQNCCAYCGQTGKLTLDHYIPISASNCPGTVAHNIIPACGRCNTSKRNNPISTWLVKKFGEKQAQEIEARIQAYFMSL